jgi:hypothetical protein
VIRFQHVHKQLDNTAWGVELAALFALGKANAPRKYSKTCPSKSALRVLTLGKRTVTIKSMSSPRLVGSRILACIYLGQHSLERRVVLLDSIHGTVDNLAYEWIFSIGYKMFPACIAGT